MSSYYCDRIKSPLGDLRICASDAGVCLLSYDEKDTTSQIEYLERTLEMHTVEGEHPYITQTRLELEGYFEGKRQVFSVPLHVVGTEFQRDVWSELLSIPFGETISYQTQAARIGRSKAVRAVGGTNAKNRISIIAPCHRVIGKNGTLTGYAGGLDRKQWLLEHERRQLAKK